MSEPIDPLTPKYKRVLLKLSGESLGHRGARAAISLDETGRHRRATEAHSRPRRPTRHRDRRRKHPPRGAVHRRR